ncbi:lasso RiPP family leader peptide-containing protein [Plantactinospora sonchi]|uniref:Lasso RiPP family leader peptide-containing protein n=1 Tax=Plantactinospora sonchi TaxID=1544735 RepID=A0ABU7S452_9ACTN
MVQPYDPPRLVLVGDFTEQTRLVGGWMFVDGPFYGGWWNG